MRKTTFILLIGIVLTGLIISGCTGNNSGGRPSAYPIQPAVVMEVPIVEVMSDPAGYDNIKITGTVQQTIEVTGYTYIEVADSTGSMWVAGSAITLDNGSQITATGTLMDNFHSTSLDRTFDVILFADTVTDGTTSSSSHGSDNVIIEDVNVTPVEGGTRIEDVGADLKDEQIRVAAVVVNAVGLKNETFLTLQDGTGELKATISDSVAVGEGDEVVVTGTVRTDVDYGMGYFYPVLLEITELE